MRNLIILALVGFFIFLISKMKKDEISKRKKYRKRKEIISIDSKNENLIKDKIKKYKDSEMYFYLLNFLKGEFSIKSEDFNLIKEKIGEYEKYFLNDNDFNSINIKEKFLILKKILKEYGVFKEEYTKDLYLTVIRHKVKNDGILKAYGLIKEYITDEYVKKWEEGYNEFKNKQIDI
ncbi:MAG: hypothetical protein M0R46_01005 [Candidatus Muirbacterium halophilum]|nr:hypothetical protein [Candidatus Muirbacterium halophilum]